MNLQSGSHTTHLTANGAQNLVSYPNHTVSVDPPGETAQYAFITSPPSHLPTATSESRTILTFTTLAPKSISAPSDRGQSRGTRDTNQIRFRRNAAGFTCRENASKRVDLEKVKFRLVFILWPALIGITMAL
jgi:hypothetical protein